MIEEEDLALGVLNFTGASFGFERAVKIGELDLVLFSRRETESEAKFRPRIVRRWVLVPRAWIFLDRNGEVLVLGKDGKRPHQVSMLNIQSADGTRPAREFTEQGIAFRTEKFPDDLELYVIAAQRADVLTDEGLGALGLPPPSSG